MCLGPSLISGKFACSYEQLFTVIHKLVRVQILPHFCFTSSSPQKFVFNLEDFIVSVRILNKSRGLYRVEPDVLGRSGVCGVDPPSVPFALSLVTTTQVSRPYDPPPHRKVVIGKSNISLLSCFNSHRFTIKGQGYLRPGRVDVSRDISTRRLTVDVGSLSITTRPGVERDLIIPKGRRSLKNYYPRKFRRSSRDLLISFSPVLIQSKSLVDRDKSSRVKFSLLSTVLIITM